MTDKTYDVAVIGAGTAGLQAALTLGRMRRTVAVFGTDRYRNDPATHMQNFLGHDGEPPAELRAAARKDVERYPTVELVESAIAAISGGAGAFSLEVAGGSTVTARRVVLATGVVDELPDVPGLEPLFGDVVAHCPFCHGFELADTPIAILGATPHVPMVAAMIGTLAAGTTVLTDGAELSDEARASLEGMGVDVRDERVLGVCRSALGLSVELEGAARLELGGMFVSPAWSQATPFAEQLGLETGELGGIHVDAMGQTSVPGVYAAGDLAHHRDLPMPMASVLTAASAGLIAAAACHGNLAVTDAGLSLG